MNYTFAPVTNLTEKFPKQYTNFSQADSFLNEVKLKIGKAEASIYRYQNNETEDEREAERKNEELAEVNEHMIHLNSIIPKMKSDTLATRYKKELMEEKDRKIKLERWMVSNNPNKNNMDFISNELDQAALQYYRAVALAFCEWFETGAAGPGTLVFEGKEYTVV